MCGGEFFPVHGWKYLFVSFTFDSWKYQLLGQAQYPAINLLVGSIYLSCDVNVAQL